MSGPRPLDVPADLASPPSEMAAIVQHEYGSTAAAVLAVETVAIPTCGPEDLLVHVHAASVDRGTWHLMAGLPYPIRLAVPGPRRPKATNPGRCFAGTVAWVGGEVTGYERGDAVYGTCDSTFAEYARANPARLAPMPENLTHAQAAAVPVSAQTALQAVRDHALVQRGQRLLIIGASGGVGSFAVQIAKAFGAHVTGVCSTAKVGFVRALGADHVVDYTTEALGETAERFDSILDIGGNRPLRELRGLLARTGTLVIVGGETDGRWLGGVDRQLRALVLSRFVEQSLGTFIASENHTDLDTLRGMIEAGDVTPAVDRTFPLSGTAAAIEHVVAGRAQGKVVVTI